MYVHFWQQLYRPCCTLFTTFVCFRWLTVTPEQRGQRWITSPRVWPLSGRPQESGSTLSHLYVQVIHSALIRTHLQERPGHDPIGSFSITRSFGFRGLYSPELQWRTIKRWDPIFSRCLLHLVLQRDWEFQKRYWLMTCKFKYLFMYSILCIYTHCRLHLCYEFHCFWTESLNRTSRCCSFLRTLLK